MSSFDRQYRLYDQLNCEHLSTRREDQEKLLTPIEQLKAEVNQSLVDDKQTYDRVKAAYKKKFHLFQRLLTSAASKYRRSSLAPVTEIFQHRRDLAQNVLRLCNETREEIDPLQIRHRWNGSIAVVYDPITGRSHWKESYHGGIHGVFNPSTRTIEWQEELRTGVYGVFNPQLNIVEWKKSLNGGVHGVYNPVKRTIEWNISFNCGVGGVFNPLTEQVEWKTSWNGGVVGYFNHQSQTVKWMEKWHHGLALIVWDPVLRTYQTSTSCGWYGDK